MTDSPLRDRRILAVEDDWFIAVQIGRDLAAAGAVVLGPVPSVAKAQALIAAEPRIDAAVIDVNLGGEKSFAVADALSARGVPFMFATGYSDGDLGVRYPGILRCDKPFDFPVLERMLAAILNASGEASTDATSPNPTAAADRAADQDTIRRDG